MATNPLSNLKFLDHLFVGVIHGLINCKDTKAKCRHQKKLICKGTLRQVFIRVYRLEIFDPALLSVAPLTFSLVFNSPHPPPPFWV
jgi:hypothetical protein